MSTAAYHPIGGLEEMEDGLNKLRRSQMMIVPEFKAMYFAIDRHHKDIKLAHLTGKAKDLQDQAIRDTKFYNILVEMLCEVKEKRAKDQREGLRRVHTWYQSNKHVLNCGPRFGKQRIKEESKEVHLKATSARPKRAKSAVVRPSSNRVKVNPSRSAGKFNNNNNNNSEESHAGESPRVFHDQSVESLEIEFINQGYDPARGYDPILDSPHEVENATRDATGEQLVNTERDSSVHSSQRVLSRPKTASHVSFSPLKEQSTNQRATPSPFGKRPVHPITSMVNPHTALANDLAPQDPKEMEEKQLAAPIRTGSAMGSSRSENLQAWHTFNKNRSYGQEVVGQLSFAGRSGTASDVRYTAHQHGERPEVYTKDVIRHFAKHIVPTSTSSKGAYEEDGQAFMNKTLEDFYIQADNMFSPRHAAPKSTKIARIKSAPPKVPTGIKSDNSVPSSARSSISGPQKLGHQLEEIIEPEQPEEEPQPVNTTGVKLDTVIHVIDSVTDDMTYFKEKVVPQANSGHRQPSTSGLPTPRDSTAPPSEYTEYMMCPTPTGLVDPRSEDGEIRPFTSPMASHTVVMKEEDTTDDPSRARGSQVRCQSAGVIDWRGKVQPDTMRYKWSKTKFGGHTYLKKWTKPSMRSAGSTQGGNRPKTAPSSRDKWRTHKESDKNTKAVGAATHSTMIVNQEDVDNMITVQHLLNGEDRTDSMGSLMEFDENFWKSLRGTPTLQPAPQPSLEFLSIITPSAAAIAEQRALLGLSHRTEESDLYPGSSRLPSDIHLPQSGFDQEALNAALREDNSLRTDLSPSPWVNPSDQLIQTKEEKEKTETENPTEPHSKIVSQQGSSFEVPSIQPPGGRCPTPSHLRQYPLQELSQSEPWQLSAEKEFCEPEELKKVDHFCDVQLIPEHSCPECRTVTMTTKVERSAGRMPSRANSATGEQMVSFSRRYAEAFRRAPPLRTPPSIPTPTPSATKPRRRPQFIMEVEYHARKTRSPRNFMHRIAALRSMDTSRSGYTTDRSPDPLVGTSLQVCRLPTGGTRGRMSQTSEEMDFDLNTPKIPTDTSFYTSREHSSLRAIDESMDHFHTERAVTFHDPQHTGSSYRPSTTAPGGSTRQSTFTSLPEDVGLQRNATFTSIGSRMTGRSAASGDQSHPPPSRNIARIGRPIAQISVIPDPDELHQAVQVQKEAAAAVDIQRLFRGYVARNVYKELLSEERQKAEDARKAAVKIQSLYRGHVSRKTAILNRPPLNPELVDWAKDLKSVQTQNKADRRVKAEILSHEMSTNQHEAKSKISVIGPHVEVYDIYHPKKSGPTKKELNLAAIMIQKLVRGWMVRRKMEKLARKATWVGSTFPVMVKEYKALLKQVQRQHGVDRVKTPFSIKDMNDYIDTRRRYESVFDKKAFGGELEHAEIEAFFKECDLYPSLAEIEDSMDVTMHGHHNRAPNQGLKKKELMDMIFYIYVPTATELTDTRQSTWMSPIIDGQEARKLLGTEYVEPAPLGPCLTMMADQKKYERSKEVVKQEAEKRKRIEDTMNRLAEEKKLETESRRVSIVEEKKQTEARRVSIAEEKRQSESKTVSMAEPQ